MLHRTSALLESKSYTDTENKARFVQQKMWFWESELVIAALSRKNSMSKENTECGSSTGLSMLKDV